MDVTALRTQGFVHVPKLIEPELLAEFEATMAALGETGLARKRLARQSADALIDLLQVGGDYRVRLFNSLKNLYVIHRMGHSVAQRLEDEGFFAWARLTAPLLYPAFRADIPGEQTYLLPMHQDYATQCATAWRFWIPLRDATPKAGTMRIVPGSHARGVLAHDTTDPKRPFVPESQYPGLEPVVLELPAGDGVLFDPLLVHGSVPATGKRMKYTLLIQVQDLATIADADDPDDPLPARLATAVARDRARDAAIAAAKG